MKPHTFFRAALFTPYILWGFCVLLLIPLTSIPAELSESLNIFLIPAMFYTIGILLWFLPYTILTITLWIWSINKPITSLRQAALLSPIFLSFLMIGEAGLIYLLTNDITEFVESAFSIFAFFGVLSLVFGYLCVGIAFGMHQLLQIKGLIAVENTSPPFA